MAEFLGWLSYELTYYCKECDEFYEEEDKDQHESCACECDG